MNKVSFVLCEGPHDVAFLYRILKTEGYVNFGSKIADFPAPINRYLLTSLSRISFDDLSIEEARKLPLPSEAMYYNDSYLLLFALGGDSKKGVRQEILKKINSLVAVSDDAINPGEGIEFSLLYFFDADDKGVSNRLAGLKNEITEVLGIINDSAFFETNGGISNINGVKYGAYIFSSSEEKGKLENILVPLMKKDNETLFEKADEYLSLKDEKRLRKLEISSNNGELTENRGKKLTFDPMKSQICIAGQLQNSGKSNVVIIKDCDYITMDKIKQSEKCNEIIEFFRKI